MGCAVPSRSLERTNTIIPEACTRFFNRYCWDGNTDTRTLAAYEPKLGMAEVKLNSVAANAVFARPPNLIGLCIILRGVLGLAWDRVLKLEVGNSASKSKLVFGDMWYFLFFVLIAC